MKIEKITSRSRRDFYAIYVCEHCGATKEGYGYDDSNFHVNVIPTMECAVCGKTAADTYKPLATRHPDNAIV